MRINEESVSLMIVIIVVVNLKTNKEQISFVNQLESTLHCEFAKRTRMRECLDGCQASSIECQHCQLGNRGY